MPQVRDGSIYGNFIRNQAIVAVCIENSLAQLHLVWLYVINWTAILTRPLPQPLFLHELIIMPIDLNVVGVSRATKEWRERLDVNEILSDAERRVVKLDDLYHADECEDDDYYEHETWLG